MSEPATGVAPAQRSPWRWIMLLFVGLLVIAFVLVPLININRYHRTVAESLGRSLGHPVHLGSVQLQVLPHTGLAVTDFVVEENPGFGSEPILRAPSVLVTLRLASLWGGHIEPSRIDIDSASVNLVRNANGQWNFNNLLAQAAQPADGSAPEEPAVHPRLPYIEFRSARINFKNGAEKKPFSFLNSDLSVWQEDSALWRLRFEGQPARTDLEVNLADTGLLRLEGSLARAPTQGATPLNLHAEWRNAPLGQVSRLLFDEDSGWRGLLTAEADFAGDLENLRVNTRVRVDNAHRQEFTPLKQLNIDARCRAAWNRDAGSLDNVTCLSPAGDGHLLLTGSIQTPPHPQASLALEINHAPAAFALDIFGLLRRGVTASVDSGGLINGHFSYVSAAPARLTGEATVEPLVLSFRGLEQPLRFPALHLTTPDLASPVRAKSGYAKRNTLPPREATTVLLQPAPLDLGAPNPVQISGQLALSGFQVRIAGQVNLYRFAGIARASGFLGSSLPSIRPLPGATAPPAVSDLTFAGPWITPLNSTSPPATTVGSLRIDHAGADFAWLPGPVEISATVSFAPDQVSWTNATIEINGIEARGSYSRAFGCPANKDCNFPGFEPAPGHFDLDIPKLDVATLQSSLTGSGQSNEILSAILGEGKRKTASWPPLEGTVNVGSFLLGNLTFHDAHAAVSVSGDQLSITSLQAGALGGAVNASGTLQMRSGRPLYFLNVSGTGFSVPQIAALFHEKWGAGVLSGKATLSLSGYTAPELSDSARGTFSWDWNRGSLAAPPTIREASLTGPSSGFSPARFSHWKTSGTIANKALHFESPASPDSVSGSIGFDRTLDLSWPATARQKLRIGGTLENPALEAAP
ncbi:MAG: AsmA family protein [Silvibacterium sp.]|nr:AsmA family protein [Silvibacterium sp.]